MEIILSVIIREIYLNYSSFFCSLEAREQEFILRDSYFSIVKKFIINKFNEAAPPKAIASSMLKFPLPFSPIKTLNLPNSNEESTTDLKFCYKL
jgi:hypothetical protein